MSSHAFEDHTGDVRIRVEAPTCRRRRRTVIARRRPAYLHRRRVRVPNAVIVHGGEREIIARS